MTLDLRREAGARFRRAERASVKLTLRVMGDPTLRAKSVVELRGCGSLLDGKYYATSVKHEVSGSGYVCSVALTRDAKGRLARRAAGTPQGGTHNTAEKPKPGETTVVERVDGESGGTWLEFRAEGPASADPEGGGSET